MRHKEFVELAERAIDRRKRVMVVGPPGVGKSDAWAQACQHKGAELITICAPLEDPSTIRGYPARNPATGEATHCLFDGMARAFKAEKPTVLLFDDLGMAAESTMRSIVRVVQHGEIDGKRLPEHVLIAAATNDIGHSAGVYGMIEPLKSRFHTIVNLDCHIDDVAVYALSRNWPADLIAFLRNEPGALHDWKPEKSMKVGGACPRSWEYVSEWINDGCDDPEVLEGCVGKGRAAQYLAYRKLINDLPDIAQIMMDPEGAPVPDNPSAKWLVSCSIAARINGKTFGQAIKYLNRVSGVFRAYSIRDAFKAEVARKKEGTLPKDHVPIASSRDFVAWATSSDGKNVMEAAEA